MTVSVPNSTRLSYRLMTPNDGALILDLDSDPEVMKYINGGKPTTEQELEQVYIPRFDAFSNPEQGWGIWLVYTQDDNAFIGWVLARPMNFFTEQRDLKDIELGWRFKQASWGKGYATEAAKAVLQTLHKDLGYNKFSAIAVSDNIGSIKIMKKLGMQFVKKELHQDPLYEEVVEYYQILL